MISQAQFMGGSYDPTVPATFEEDGRVILIPSGHGATFTLPLHYSKFRTDPAKPTLARQFTGGPCFYIVNHRVGTLTVEDTGANTLFTVPASSVAEVLSFSSGYKAISKTINAGTAAGFDAGRDAITTPDVESIDTSAVCGDPVYKLTDCDAVETTKYVEDELTWEDLKNKSVQLEGFAGVNWLVTKVDPLPSGETIESVVVTGITDSGCPTCEFLGSRFNGYIGPAAAEGQSNWKRLLPTIWADLIVPSYAERYCYQLWIYEGVIHDGVKYDLSSASKVTALRTPTGFSTANLIGGSARSAYSPLYTGWSYAGAAGEQGSASGTLLEGYPWRWESVIDPVGHIGGYEIDILNPSMTFDVTALTTIYDTLNTDLAASLPSAGAGNEHTLLLYVRLNSYTSVNRATYLNPGVTWWSNFRDPWSHLGKTVYVAGDEIRPGTTGVTTEKQTPTHSWAFRCTVGGTIGGSEPIWDNVLALGDTIVDNGVTWMAVPVTRMQDQYVYLMSAHVSCDPA